MPVPMVLVMNVRVVVADLLVLVFMDVLGGGIESGAMRVSVMSVEVMMAVRVADRVVDVKVTVAVDRQRHRASDAQSQGSPARYGAALAQENKTPDEPERGPGREEAGIERSTISTFAWLGFAYSLKFVWVPVVDSFRLPIKLPQKPRGYF